MIDFLLFKFFSFNLQVKSLSENRKYNYEWYIE